MAHHSGYLATTFSQWFGVLYQASLIAKLCTGSAARVAKSPTRHWRQQVEVAGG